MKRKIIIDCDPGHDDAVALVLATRTEDIDLLGVTVVAGNSSLSHTLQNALNVLAFAGAEQIPVYAGCEKPLMRALRNQSGAMIHGSDGLGNYRFEVTPNKPQEKHAVDFLTETLLGADEKITLICLGPLTNIAAAFEKEPESKKNVERLIVMGGAVDVPGNVTTAAEFNFYTDPEAAKLVINSGCRICLHPLDVTMKALFDCEDIGNLKKSENKLSHFVGTLLELYAGTYSRELGLYACPLHDALCIGILTEPSLVQYKRTALDVSLTKGEEGKSIVDIDQAWVKPENVWYGTEIDSRGFVRFVSEMVLKSYTLDQ